MEHESDKEILQEIKKENSKQKEKCVGRYKQLPFNALSIFSTFLNY